MNKVISSSLSPNVEFEDILSALFTLLQPWSYREGGDIKRLERYFEEHFHFRKCIAFNSGRSCMLAIFDAIGLIEGDEVIVQAYTCNAVINPILKKKAIPVYVDVNSELNMDTSKLLEKISPKTKVIIAQHTFGNPCEIEEIKEICSRHGIILIEDCAHALGATYRDKYCGVFGDFAFFSFGRDKVVSSVYGGMLLINNENYIDKVLSFRESLFYPSQKWVLQQLLHPIITGLFVLPLYFSKIGRGILAYSLNLGILSRSVTESENHGILPDYFPLKMPNALAKLALLQMHKLERYNLWRRSVANYYKDELSSYKGLFYDESNNSKRGIYMRFPIFLDNTEEMIEYMRGYNIYLDDGWRDSVIVPPKTNRAEMFYEEGSCPVAEILSCRVVSLPTNIRINEKDMKRVVELLKIYLDKKNEICQD